ncbi:MAG: hypothetical protein M0020_06430 [Actinomycetota bacterium]|nr:hypothetical protein [Actinomycetota bacterium]
MQPAKVTVALVQVEVEGAVAGAIVVETAVVVGGAVVGETAVVVGGLAVVDGVAVVADPRGALDASEGGGVERSVLPIG